MFLDLFAVTPKLNLKTVKATLSQIVLYLTF